MTRFTDRGVVHERFMNGAKGEFHFARDLEHNTGTPQLEVAMQGSSLAQGILRRSALMKSQPPDRIVSHPHGRSHRMSMQRSVCTRVGGNVCQQSYVFRENAELVAPGMDGRKLGTSLEFGEHLVPRIARSGPTELNEARMKQDFHARAVPSRLKGVQFDLEAHQFREQSRIHRVSRFARRRIAHDLPAEWIGFLPAEGFEPPTNGLQNRCSTTELSRHSHG